MRLLFVHDTKIKEDNHGNYYTDGSYNEKVWNRYLSICSELSVVARKEKIIYKTDIATKRFNYFNKDKINFIEVPDPYSSISDFFNLKQRKNIFNTIKEAVLKNDILIARLPSTNGNIAVYYANKFNKPYLVEVVGCSWDSLWNYNFKGKILAPLNYLKQKNIIRKSKYVVYVTSSFLQKRYPTRGYSTNCSNVLLTNFDDSILKKRINKINGLNPEGKLIIGTIAAVDVRYKGQDSVIKALGRLKKEQGIRNYEYQLVGGGNQSYLISLAKKYDVLEQVKFLGSMPHTEVLKWLDSIDIYVQPSKTEGLPRALIEAMSRGLLVMGSNAGGIPELIDSKYLFNKSKNEKQIKKLLLNISKEDFLNEAQRNLEVAKQYDSVIIEKRRKEFLKMFVMDSKKN